MTNFKCLVEYSSGLSTLHKLSHIILIKFQLKGWKHQVGGTAPIITLPIYYVAEFHSSRMFREFKEFKLPWAQAENILGPALTIDNSCEY